MHHRVTDLAVLKLYHCNNVTIIRRQHRNRNRNRSNLWLEIPEKGCNKHGDKISDIRNHIVLNGYFSKQQTNHARRSTKAGKWGIRQTLCYENEPNPWNETWHLLMIIPALLTGLSSSTFSTFPNFFREIQDHFRKQEPNQVYQVTVREPRQVPFSFRKPIKERPHHQQRRPQKQPSRYEFDLKQNITPTTPMAQNSYATITAKCSWRNHRRTLFPLRKLNK